MRAYYYGCWERAGHYLWEPGRGGVPVKVGRQVYELLGRPRYMSGPHPEPVIPWGWSIDGCLLKGRGLRQGDAVSEQRDGWTALSFWDSSVDARPGSTSSFMFDEAMTPPEALEAARTMFPPIFARFGFAVALAA